MVGREFPTRMTWSRLTGRPSSFIYDLYNSNNLPWVYGGEYAEFTRLVKTVVEAWIKVGLQVSFVFDGEDRHLLPPFFL